MDFYKIEVEMIIWIRLTPNYVIYLKFAYFGNLCIKMHYFDKKKLVK